MRKLMLGLLSGVAIALASPAVLAQDAPPEDAPSTTQSASGAESTGDAPSGTAVQGTRQGKDERSAFNRELGTIEEEVNGLKEQVFRSKATLQLLKEIVVQGSSTGSRATVWHVNKLGSAYSLESIAYYVDGQGKFSKSDPSGALDASKEFKVFDGALPPGNHNLTVNMKLRGTGYGVFSYVKDYNFSVQSSTAFSAEEGKNCQIKVIATQRKGIGRSFTERPSVTFETQCVALDEAVTE